MLFLAEHYPVPPFIPTLTNDEFRRLAPDATCPTCRGEKTFLWDRDDSGPVAEPVRWQCDCLNQIILRNYLDRCGLSRQLYWRTAEELPVFERGDTPLAEYSGQIDEYARAGINLILAGDSISGKSTWATFCLKVFITKKWDVQCMSLDALADAYTATWMRKGKNDQYQQANMEWFANRVLTVPVLLIDNIGRNTQRNDLNTVQQAFTRVTSERVETGRVTIMTFSGDPKLEFVTTQHLQATTVTASLGGPDLTKANQKRLRADAGAGIHRPLRLI